LYLLTGNKTLIQWAYNITKNSLLRAERDAFDTSTGLFTGCSSFMESNSGYPTEYKSNGKMVGKTKALSTNILHYDGYYLASKMGDEVGAPRRETRSLLRKAKSLQRAIRSRLWRDDLGYYSYMEDMNNQTVDQMEGLGESLALLSDDFETDQRRIDAIFRWTPRTTRGIPCLWPRFPIEERQMMIATYYHNGRIWPFVQSYWAIAAARHQKLTIFQDELHSLLKLSRTKNTFAEFYELDGSFPSSRSRQLWSSSGFLGMVYFGLFGITFTPDGILFRPIKPWMGLSKTISLTNFHYRNIVLDIYVTGFGSNVKSFLLDDVVQENPFIPSTLIGHHIVKLTLD
jgi:GH15 family glucan-1,4-alpha-glucosidase